MTAALLLYTCALMGGDCHYTVVHDNVPAIECQKAGMIEAVRYAREHPKRVFVKYVCTDPRRLPFYLGRFQA